MAPVMSHRDSRVRAEKAWQLRSLGRSWHSIMTTLDYGSTGAVQTAVKAHLKRDSGDSPEVSRRSLLESARITHSVIFDRFAVGVAAGEDATVALLSREMRGWKEIEAKLTGAYAPDRHEVALTTAAGVVDSATAGLLAINADRERRVIEPDGSLHWTDSEALVP